ncbi:MAG: mannose-1-phosphate guanylyltransferase [Chlorobi bacterium]|nr:mannose-1-phosphate guanylyltransferase [Chlorobiota bacterium]
MSSRVPIYAVIMAGGVGSRFWPVSTEDNPKQFLDLTGSGKSLLRQTFERLSRLMPADRILVVTNKRYIDKVGQHLPELPAENILAEPVMRNTAPAILLAAGTIHARHPEAVMTVAPSDHFIGDENRFTADMKAAMDYAATHDDLITLGIRPDSPHTGYGYIQYDPADASPFKKVLRFTEKPQREQAEKFLQEGNYLWNAGIFVWRVPVIREAFRQCLPETFRQLEKIDFRDENLQAQIDAVFPGAENISVDYGIMEKASNVKVLPVDFGWNDLGSWDALYKQLRRLSDENIVINGTLLVADASGNLIYNARPKTVIIDGLKDHLIVNDEGHLMIIPLDHAQDVKQWRQKVTESAKKKQEE